MSVPPPDRVHLAAMLRTLATSSHPYFLGQSRRDLTSYIKIAEDTITQQAAMLCRDQETSASLVAEFNRVRRDLGAEIVRLNTENATLRELAQAALIAGQLDDNGEASALIREALEKTS